MQLKYLLFAVIFLVFTNSSTVGAQLRDGDLLPANGMNVGVKAGDIAPVLALTDLNGGLKQITWGNVPAVIISLHTLDGNIEQIKQLVNLHSQQKEIRFLFIVRSGAEYARVSLLKHNLDIPVYLERKNEFAAKYNKAVPAMVIVDNKGVVRYNNTFWVDINSAAGFLKNLIASENEKKPQILYLEPAKAKNTVPELIDIGTKVPADVFRDLEGYPVKLAYKERPTVMLFWMSFTREDHLEKLFPIMQKVYEKKGAQANFYSVNGSGDRYFTMLRLDKYYTGFPTLLGGDFLQYTRVFPSIVIIDKNGILRYRMNSSVTAEELETVVTQICNLP